MNTRHIKATLFSLFILAGLTFQACKTDDVEGIVPGSGTPRVSLSASKLNFSEDSDSTQLIASLDITSNDPVTVELVLSGTAQGNGVDYFLSEPLIKIDAGQSTGSIWIIAIQDTSKEGNETITASIINVLGGISDGVQTVNLTIEDDDVPQQPNILLNEILYDPSNNGLDGDANGDGVYAQKEDEFVELINMSSKAIDLSGFKIYDTEGLNANTPNHVFPANTILAAGKAIVVFGGGTPTGTFGGALVQTSTSGDLNLNNAGDIFTLTDPNGNVVVSYDITPLSDNPNESYTRNPDLTGDFEQHGTNTPILFSPGTKIDGTPF